MYPKGMGWECVEWINLTRVRNKYWVVSNTEVDLHSVSIKCGEVFDLLSNY